MSQAKWENSFTLQIQEDSASPEGLDELQGLSWVLYAHIVKKSQGTISKQAGQMKHREKEGSDSQLRNSDP